MSKKFNLTVARIVGTIVLFFVPFIIIIQVGGSKLSEVSSSLDDIVISSKESIKSIREDVLNDINARTGQEIYVPAYSNLPALNRTKNIDFSITLSIRNTDPKKPITITSINFFNSEGDKFKKIIGEAIKIDPMATKNFTVSKSDQFGGSGANFYVKWISDTLVNEPIVEAIMLGAAPYEGYSWTSSGKVVKSVFE